MIFHLHLTHYNTDHTLHMLPNISDRIRFLWIWMFPSEIIFAVDAIYTCILLQWLMFAEKPFLVLLPTEPFSLIACIDIVRFIYVLVSCICCLRKISPDEFNWLIISNRCEAKWERKKDRHHENESESVDDNKMAFAKGVSCKRIKHMCKCIHW